MGPNCLPCEPGYWCTGGATVSSNAAWLTPKGYYYNPSELPRAMRACPAGMFGNVTGGTSLVR